VTSTRARLGLTFASLALAAILVAIGYAPARADDKEADWPKVLPETELVKLVDESGKTIQDAVRSASTFNLKAKSVENEAYVLLVYAQAGMKSGSADLAKKSAALHQTATKLAAAAKKKNLDEAKKLAAIVASFKTAKPGEEKSDGVNLGKEIPVKNLMEEVQTLFLRFDKPQKGAYKRLTKAEWEARGKTDEVATASHKMAALTMAITAHAPEKDPDAAKGQTRKVWLETTENTRTAALEMATAAKGKDQAEFKKALTRLNTACTKCHDAFRIETN
jgi:hypothetical protein